MKHFKQLQTVFPNERPWLVLGKGPTLERIVNVNLNDYYILGLNHVINYGIPVDISLFIDLEVCSLEFVEANTYILAPYHCHFNFKPRTRLFTNIISSKIYYFDCSTWKGDPVVRPIIRAKYNCAEAAFDILRHWGVKNIYSLGIDGGITYASFIQEKPLTNGQPNFDKQLGQLKIICRQGNMKWTRL